MTTGIIYFDSRGKGNGKEMSCRVVTCMYYHSFHSIPGVEPFQDSDAMLHYRVNGIVMEMFHCFDKKEYTFAFESRTFE